MNVIKRNHVRVSGQGTTTLILANGFGCGQGIWRHVEAALEKEYRLVLFDHVGSGASDLSAYDRTRYGSLQGYADDLLEICDALELKNPILVGHSVSTMIGALAAIKAPSRFKGLVMIGPSACYLNDGPYRGGFDASTLEGLLQSLESNYQEWAKAIAPVIMGRLDRPELGQELAQNFCSHRPDIGKEFARVTFLSDLRKELSKLRIPTLILQCAEDAIAPESAGRFVHETVPHSTFVQLNATGHCPHLSAPDETVSAIRAFLK